MHRIFYAAPRARFDTLARTENLRSLDSAKPTTAEALMRLMVARTDNMSHFSWWIPDLSTALVERYGDEVRPFIAPAIRHGITTKMVDIWVMLPSQYGGLIKSTERPEYFLNRSDDDLLELLDSGLFRLAAHHEFSWREAVPILAVLTAFSALTLWKVTSQIVAFVIAGLILFGLFAFCCSLIRSKETRHKFGLWMIDSVDMLRFIFLALPVRMMVWIGGLIASSASK